MNGRCVMIAGLLAVVPSLACAPVPGEGRFVHIAAEEALIIWDEAAKREHFIRRASFDTDAKNFGFLVPTPTRPELAEAGGALFERLAEITAPRAMSADEAKSARSLEGEKFAAAKAVTVLEKKVVAGLDAAVLEATDAGELDAWLKENGYPSSPSLVEWYAPYVAAKWKVTAFKIAGNSAHVSSAAIRMSFQSDKPFFPYREPAADASSVKGPRLLRVFLIAEGRVDGAIGEGPRWSGVPVWSRPIEKSELSDLLKLAKLPILAGGGARWLTEFEDRALIRGAQDLYFYPSVVQQTIERPPAYTAYIGGIQARYLAWIIAALVAGLVAFGCWRIFRRKNG